MKCEEFRRLAEDVSCCHLCEQILTLPHNKNSERLVNDDHGLSTDRPYVNRWNLWQGNLDADIMVIGQDYGIKEDGAWEFAGVSDPTGRRLKELFDASFGDTVDLSQNTCFFTNMANCYRVKKTSGGIHDGWLPLCAHKFMARLIRIVHPKIIIVLGRTAFDALHCMEGMLVQCLDPADSAKDSYAEVVCHRYQLMLDDAKIAVFPVYHPGANSQMNRSFEQQVEDWKRIADYYMD